MSNTTFELNSLVRPNILSLAPYRCARDDYDQGILLDANENAYGAPIPSELELNRYPDPYHTKLKEKIAAYRQCSVAQVFTGVGSDEAIDLIFRIFCTPGVDNIITTPPTYGMYQVSADINNIAVKESVLSERFELDADDVIAKIDDRTKVIFLCSPNNPTANSLDVVQIKKILNAFNGIVVVDEAYIDFSEQQSWVQALSDFPNLIVLQTLSKAFGLAGLRVGMAFASADIIEIFMKVKPPYNINKLSLQYAIQAFDNTQVVESNVALLKAEREKMFRYLSNYPDVIQVWPSETNYILFKIPKALQIYRAIADAGVVIRYRGSQTKCEDTLRITIGTAQENQTFIERFEDIVSQLKTTP